MSANLEAKKQVVESIKAKISDSKSVVLVNYKGLTVAEDTELRNEFRKANVEYKVLKNTLIRRAFNELGVDSFDADLNGTTAVAFGSDETGASKIVIDNAKKYDNKLVAKSAYVNGEYVGDGGASGLAGEDKSISKSLIELSDGAVDVSYMLDNVNMTTDDVSYSSVIEEENKTE